MSIPNPPEGHLINSLYLLGPGKARTDYTEKSRLHGFLKKEFGVFGSFRCFGVQEREIMLGKY
ncbi:MAG: hypothetical protein WBM17_00155, partial [Anaerolineales bacterium]